LFVFCPNHEEIWVKATNQEGNTQLIAAWNQRGMKNNSVQRC
jgi:hypothetical protein